MRRSITALTVVAVILGVAGCDKVEVDTSDTTAPIVRIFVVQPDKSLVEQSSAVVGTDAPLNLVAEVNDPQGVSRLQIEFSYAYDARVCEHGLGRTPAPMDVPLTPDAESKVLPRFRWPVALYPAGEAPGIVCYPTYVNPEACGQRLDVHLTGENWATAAAYRKAEAHLSVTYQCS